MAKTEKEIAYQDALFTCVICAKMLAEHDLAELIAAIGTADAIAPLIDPTLWLRKRDAMNEDLEVFRAAQALRAIGVKLKELERAKEGL